MLNELMAGIQRYPEFPRVLLHHRENFCRGLLQGHGEVPKSEVSPHVYYVLMGVLVWEKEVVSEPWHGSGALGIRPHSKSLVFGVVMKGRFDSILPRCNGEGPYREVFPDVY